MIPGPYAICHVTFKDNDDTAIYETIKYGYDTASQAYEAMKEVADDEDQKVDDLIVIRSIDKEESAKFSD